MAKPSAHRGYITPEGYTVLENELKYLWKVKRPEITQKVKEAAAMGDRSENAEYIYGKKQLRETDRRIRFLSKRLDDLIVVNDKPADQSRIFFGAYVELENDDGECFNYRIVGSDEFSFEKHNISINSPLAKCMLGKALGDEFLFRLKKPLEIGETESDYTETYFSILSIRYE